MKDIELMEFLEEAIIKRLDRIENKLDDSIKLTSENTCEIGKNKTRLSIYTTVVMVLNGIFTSLVAILK